MANMEYYQCNMLKFNHVFDKENKYLFQSTINEMLEMVCCYYRGMMTNGKEFLVGRHRI